MIVGVVCQLTTTRNDTLINITDAEPDVAALVVLTFFSGFLNSW